MKHHTTIQLEPTDDGHWRATQADVDLLGRGETAAAAAANYCELVDQTIKQTATDGGQTTESGGISDNE